MMGAESWRLQAQAALLRALKDRGIAYLNLDRPAYVHANHAGVAVNSLARSGAVKLVGRIRSPRPSRKGGTVALWRLADGENADALIESLEADDPQLNLNFDDMEH